MKREIRRKTKSTGVPDERKTEDFTNKCSCIQITVQDSLNSQGDNTFEGYVTDEPLVGSRGRGAPRKCR